MSSATSIYKTSSFNSNILGGFYQTAKIILYNNLDLCFEFLSGGILFMAQTLIIITISSFFEDISLYIFIKESPILVLKTVVPEFLPETIEYVLAISIVFLTSSLILNFLNSYIVGKSFKSYTNSSWRTLKLILILSVFMVFLIILGAFIESHFISTISYDSIKTD